MGELPQVSSRFGEALLLKRFQQSHDKVIWALCF
jgi:hypothetical protein